MTGRGLMKAEGFNMRKKLLSLFLVVSLNAVAVLATAEDTVVLTAQDAEELNQDSLPELDADEVVDQAIDNYFSVRGIVPGETRKGGKVYYSAKQLVAVGSENPQWAKSRQIAFEMAMIEARSDFIIDNFGRMVNEAEQVVNKDDSSNARDIPEDLDGVSKLEAIWDKAVALGDAKMNQLLLDLGVDPSDYNSIPAAQRKNLFVKQFVSRTMSTAMGDSSGLLPVQTFEGSDKSGSSVIGVIMLYSPKLKQLASDIANQRAPILAGSSGKPLTAYVDLPVDVLTAQFGVRVVFDEDGEPVVLSYGQWGYSYQGKNQQTIIRNRQSAADTADVKASEGLINFINSSIYFSDTTETGSSVEHFIQSQGDQITEKELTNIIDRSMQTIKSRSSAQLTGTRIVKKWKYKDDNGQEIIGRVRAWSPAGQQASKDIQDFNADTSAGGQESESSGSSGGGTVRAGAELGNPEEDF